VLRIGFNPTRSTSPRYNTTHACNIQSYRKYIHTGTQKMNLTTVKWAQWNKTQSRELLGLFICVCIALCTIVAHNIAHNRPDNFPSYPPNNHHCSDDVYLREGGMIPKGRYVVPAMTPKGRYVASIWHQLSTVNMIKQNHDYKQYT